MKDKKKITITYDETVTRTITCYGPHSKYILMMNILVSLTWGLFLFVPSILLLLITKDPNTILLIIGCLCLLCVISLYTIIDEWRNGRGYKLAIKMIQNNTNQEERDRAMEEFNKQEILNELWQK